MDDSIAPAIVKKVFPKGTELCLNGVADSLRSRFWMIPGKGGEPRWILPHEPEYALPVLNQWRPYDFFSRIKWKCLLAAYRRKSLGCIPGVLPLRVSVPVKSNWEHLGWSSDGFPVPVIYIGTPGQRRKAVLGLIQPQDRKVASIGKVPLGHSANLAINHEVDILDTLAKEKPGRAPRNLFVDRGKGFATQEFFPGRSSDRFLTESHMTFLADLAVPGETTSLREAAEYLGRQIKACDRIAPETRAVLERVLEEIDDPSPLPVVWEHGDFAPWNIKKATDGSLRAIDWESSSRKGLPLFDMVFFHSMQMFLFGDKELFPKAFREFSRQYLARLEIQPLLKIKIIKACIARDWLRCHESENLPRAVFLIRMLSSLRLDMA